MEPYEWKCHVCGHVNSPRTEACERCSCPAEITSLELEARQREHKLEMDLAQNKTNTGKYQCMKCGHEAYEVSEIRASGGFLSSLFDVQNRIYTAVTCRSCCYTEFYKGNSSHLANVTDFLLGG